jgi:hypothetical protein
MLIGVMLIMNLWFSGTLADQRGDADKNVRIEISAPSGNPLMSVFTVTNDSEQTIAPKQRLSCSINAIRFIGKGVMSPTILSRNQKGGTWMLMGGAIGADPTGFPPPTEESSPLLPNGDATTDSCLTLYTTTPGFLCADVTVLFQYYLDAQPNYLLYKEQRWATRYSGGVFAWYVVPRAKPLNAYCSATPQ